MTCRNCKTEIISESTFCNICGEKIPFKRLTIKSLIATAFDQVLDVDNKLLRTFKALFTKPELVIDDYVQGFRKKYVNVISYLGLAITLIGLQFFILKKFYPESLAINAEPANNPGFDLQKVFDMFYDYQGIFTIAILPINALVSRFVFLNSKKYNIAEHFVINTYTTAQAFITWFFVVMITLPLGVNYNLMSQFLSFPVLIYMIFVFKRIYPFSLKSIVFRTIAYTLLTFIAMVFLVMIITIIYIVYMKATGQIELPTKTIY